jgi:SAM-dependent methyltransferase
MQVAENEWLWCGLSTGVRSLGNHLTGYSAILKVLSSFMPLLSVPTVADDNIMTSPMTQSRYTAPHMLRRFVVSVVRKHPWTPALAAAIFLLLFLISIDNGLTHAISIALGSALAAACFLWGYSVRALKFANWPSLDHLHRRQYADTWDTLASSPSQARAAACGESDEQKLRLSAQRPVNNIVELAGIRESDDVLEIGCGVARIGLELAPRCRQWTGVDISQNMLACAADRLSGLNNARLLHLSAANLDSLPDTSFDLVYSTNMFDHLDEMDRCRYIMDAFRLLRPHGRLYVDNTDLESDAGWTSFARGVETAQHLERPAFQPTPATAAELTTYAKKIGFTDVMAHHRSPLVILTAVKPR